MSVRQNLAILGAICSLTGASVNAANCQLPKHHEGDLCAPEVKQRIRNNDQYKTLYCALDAIVPELQGLLDAFFAMPSTTTYDPLYNAAQGLASSQMGSSVLIALPDGTVVVDTSLPADLSCNDTMEQANGYCHFQNNTVGPNCNNYIAILDAQLQPCGLGVETQFNSSLQKEASVAIRLGHYLNSSGTAFITQPAT